MPYTIVKRKVKGKTVWCLKRKNGTLKSCHKTRKKAESADRVIRAKEHGWKPTRSKR